MNQRIQKSIVVVDDTPENLRLLIALLSEQGYRVRPAPNGELALASIQKEPPDLILLDILMPDMNGFEVCRRLKADDRVRDIPVIFISALDEVFDKLTAFTVGGLDYITKPFQVEEVLARVQTHLSLREARQQLEERNQELEAFAHTVAHDLKSPLATLIGCLYLVTEIEDQLSGSSQDLLNSANATANRMNTIIDELLLLASVRKEKVQMVPVYMHDVVQLALDRIGHMIDQYQPQITAPDTWPVVIGHAPWIEEIWVNYLSNAIKYGGTPPHLYLGTDAEYQGMIRFWIRDNGAGIDPSAQAGLFTEFTRLDKVHTKGHGLGLSIVRRIVDKLGGQVGFESTLNEGSLFYFTLPVS
jgi:two-component system, sensor histidine kinase and response regulator